MGSRDEFARERGNEMACLTMCCGAMLAGLWGEKEGSRPSLRHILVLQFLEKPQYVDNRRWRAGGLRWWQTVSVGAQ